MIRKLYLVKSSEPEIEIDDTALLFTAIAVAPIMMTAAWYIAVVSACTKGIKQ